MELIVFLVHISYHLNKKVSKIAMKSTTKIRFFIAIFGILLYYINIRYLINFKSKILILRNFYLKLKPKLKNKNIRRKKLKVNQVINIDKTKEKDYNKINLTNEVTFTYYDYLKYKLFEKMQKAKNTTLHEQKEKYEMLEQQENRINNEHDKVFRKILSDKIEVTKFWNEQLYRRKVAKNTIIYDKSIINRKSKRQ